MLLIAGEHARSRYFSEEAYKAAAQPKDLMIINDANHVDLYDRMDKIPFDKISEFFGKNLKQEPEMTGAATGHVSRSELHDPMLSMAKIFITGSTDGLGRAAARALIDEGHQVVLHARSRERASTLDDLASRSAGVVVGDLGSAVQTRSVAEQVNAIGRMDAVIHNAGISSTKGRSATPEGHATILAVNTLAPTCSRHSSNVRADSCTSVAACITAAPGSLRDINWSERRWNSSRAYSDSKLYLTALAFAVARRWPEVLSNAVDPGWVPTKMGGPSAPDDFEQGYLTQAWLAASDDSAATVSGRYIGITADRTITIDDRTGVERYPYVLESERPVRALDD